MIDQNNPFWRHRLKQTRCYRGWRMVAKFCHFEIWESGSEENDGFCRRLCRDTRARGRMIDIGDYYQ